MAKAYAIMVKVYIIMAKVYVIMIMAHVIMAMLHDNGLYQSIYTYHDDNYTGCVYHMQWKHHTINNNKAV